MVEDVSIPDSIAASLSKKEQKTPKYFFLVIFLFFFLHTELRHLTKPY